MSGSTDTAATTPAWKKLGLKLKHSQTDEAANGSPGSVGQPDRAQQGKRKLHAASAASDYNSSPLSAKKPRRDLDRSSTGDATPQLKRKKSVAFADTPTNKTAAPGSTTARKTPAKPPLPKTNKSDANNKKSPTTTPKKSKKAKQQQPTADTKPALEYLRLWVSSRDSWKFNKNHQSTLIRAVFDSGIPPADVGSFYDYIDDIKGAVRMRLRETALAIRLKDNTDRGAAGFPAGTADPDGKQEIYEAAIAGFLEAQQQAAQKKRTFAEVDYVTTAQDADVIIRRLVKRMRAEMVIATLSDGDETDDASTSIRATSKPARPAAAAANANANATAADVKTNGISGKRRRKLRTNVDDSDTSSSDESSDDSDDDDSDEEDSGSDTSSSGSDDDSSDDEEADEDENMDDEDDSSSSSSSSSDDDSDDEDSDDEAAVSSTKGEKTAK